MPLIDSLSDQYGVESVCDELAIAPSTFYWHKQRNKHPEMYESLEQALWARRPGSGVMHHSARGSQYVSLAYTQRLKDAEVMVSVGSVGDSYDNALAESINGLYKAEVIHRQSWKNRQDVELATLDWVDWFNNRRLLERIGYVPPFKAEQAYYASLVNKDLAA